MFQLKRDETSKKSKTNVELSDIFRNIYDEPIRVIYGSGIVAYFKYYHLFPENPQDDTYPYFKLVFIQILIFWKF